MLLSIIIPHHNRQDELSELLDTVPFVEGVEVIIVDDHSEKEVKTGSNPCIRILNLQEDHQRRIYRISDHISEELRNSK